MSNAIREKRIIRIIIVCVLMLCLVMPATLPVSAASSSIPNATGKINAGKGVYLRAKPSMKSKKVKMLRNNTAVVISEEIFESKKTINKKKRWYKVSVAGKRGYVRADRIDSIKFPKVTMQVKGTRKLSYRTGPSTSFLEKGKLKKGTKVTVVMKAHIRGLQYPWYKIKKGNKYYFVSKYYLKKVKTKKKATTVKKKAAKKAAAKKAPTVFNSGQTLIPEQSDSAAATQLLGTEDANLGIVPKSTVVDTPTLETNVTDITVSGTDIMIAGLRFPVNLAQGNPFSVMGIITSSKPIDHVKVGVVNSSGEWLIYNEADGGENTFNIFSLDSDIKFGTLAAGSYTYKVIVTSGGKNYTAGSYKFKVFKLKGPGALANVAIKLAWPVGTEHSKYMFKGGSAYPAYTKAMDTVFPGHDKWGRVTRVGASCDVFVSTVCRYSGYDSNMPTARQAQARYLKTSPKWKEIDYHYDESELRSGDIIIYRRSNGNGHICFYVKVNGKGCLIEAAYKEKFGYVNQSIRKALKPAKNVIEFRVYRATS